MDGERGGVAVLLPTAPEDLTADWLNAVLSEQHPDANVESVQILDWHQGAATRLRLKVRYTEGQDDRLPRLFFLKTILTEKRHVADRHMYTTEVQFYRDVRPELDIETPRVYGTGMSDDARQFIVLMEDLAARDVRLPVALTPVTADEAAAMMSTLAGLHAPFWASPRLDTEFGFLETMTTGGYPEWLLGDWARKLSRDELAIDYKAAVVDPEVYPVDRLYAALERLMRIAEQAPRTVLHGDTHVGNTYLTHQGGAGLLDWQLARRGAWHIDVNYYLVTALDIETRRLHERELVVHYLDELRSRGVDPPHELTAWDLYRQTMIWGVIAWLVTPASYHGLETVETCMQRTMTACEDLDTFQALGV